MMYLVCDLRKDVQKEKFVRWWRPDAKGYTDNIREAGAFSYGELKKYYNAQSLSDAYIFPLQALCNSMIHTDLNDIQAVPNTFTMRQKIKSGSIALN